MNKPVFKSYKVKFFGAKSSRGEQVKQVKTTIKALDEANVHTVLQRDYAVIKGLKVRECTESTSE